MADPAPTGTVVPAPQGDGSTTPDFKVPDGKVLIDATEQQNWQRQREQLAGLTRFHGEATKRGFAKPDDFGKYDRFTETLKKRGMTMEQIQELIADKKAEDAQASGGGQFDPAVIDKHLSEKGYLTKDQVNQEFTVRDARSQHARAMDAESGLLQKHMKELLSDGASAREKYLIENAVQYLMHTKRAAYPEGHPLAQEALAAYDDKTLSALIAEAKKNIALGEGDDLAKLADATNGKGKTPTPAGASGSQPSKAPSKDTQMRSGGRPPAADVEAKYAAIKARRSGGPVSQR